MSVWVFLKVIFLFLFEQVRPDPQVLLYFCMYSEHISACVGCYIRHLILSEYIIRDQR